MLCLSTQPTLRVTDTSGGIANSQPCVSTPPSPLLSSLGQGYNILTTLTTLFRYAEARSTFVQGYLPPTELIAVDAANTGRMFLISWADMSVISQISSKKRSTSRRSETSEEDEIEYDVDYVQEGETEYPITYVEDLPESVRKTLIKQKDVKRDTITCSLNVNYEPPSDDWFGLGGAVNLFVW